MNAFEDRELNYPILVEKGSEEVLEITSNLVIGRKEGDKIINDEKLSRKHVKFSWRNNRFYVKDLGSSNGTYVNNFKISSGGEVEAKEGATIKIGRQYYVLCLPNMIKDYGYTHTNVEINEKTEVTVFKKREKNYEKKEVSIEDLKPAEVSSRVLAFLLDSVLYSTICITLGTLTSIVTAFLLGMFDDPLIVNAIFFVTQFLIWGLPFYYYYIVFTRDYGMTIGKKLFNIHVVDANSGTLIVSSAKVFLRELFLKPLAVAIFPITIILYMTNKKKMAFHDLICRTFVVSSK